LISIIARVAQEILVSINQRVKACDKLFGNSFNWSLLVQAPARQHRN